MSYTNELYINDISIFNDSTNDTMVIKYNELSENEISHNDINMILAKKAKFLIKNYDNAFEILTEKINILKQIKTLIDNETRKTKEKIMFFNNGKNKNMVQENNEKIRIMNRIIKIMEEENI